MEPTNGYNTLTDIRLRKEQLHNEILKDDQKIKDLWSGLFQPNSFYDKNASPSKRFSGFMNIGAGVIDGILLGWKLYRKFR